MKFFSVQFARVVTCWAASFIGTLTQAAEAEVDGSAVAKSAVDWESSRRHWAFQPIKHPPPPTLTGISQHLQPLDRFVLAQLQHHELQPNPLADRRTLIRRATFDLTGLPPTPGEIEQFLNDSSADSFERLVERLLASPAYGERWGRHWLDVARYADTAGDGADYPVREAVKYRDWVIRAFNTDQPFDQFVREQIAGDILGGQDLSDQHLHRVTATGFLAIGKRYGYQPSPDYQHLDFADTIDSVGRSLLGLSLGCARCHDHKYDPVTAADYYAIYGIFQSTRWAFPGGEEQKRPSGFPPLIPAVEAARLDKAKATELAVLDEMLIRLKRERTALDDKSIVTPVASPADLADRIKKLEAEIATTAKLREAEAAKDIYPVAYGVSEDKPVNARIQLRGEPGKLGDEVPRRFLEVLGGDPVPAGATGSGRLELATWLTRRANPLTARVFVNRVWQWHFGQGLVTTPSDFGLRGEPPSHPELLDWLASEFIASGWSVKALHRLILRSQTYQLASDDHAANFDRDPANRWLWRHPRQPLDAESIRDAMLAVSGRLDRNIPGPHPFPPVQTWGFTIHNPFHAVYDSDHRSVYLMQQRNRRNPYLALFDAADPNQSMAQRLPTTTPTQTLYLMNSSFVQQQSQAFARRLLAASVDDAARVQLAFEMAQGRAPSKSETREAISFLSVYRQKLAGLKEPPQDDGELAWSGLARVLLTSNAFLYVD